jgi:hypothetical protein
VDLSFPEPARFGYRPEESFQAWWFQESWFPELFPESDCSEWSQAPDSLESFPELDSRAKFAVSWIQDWLFQESDSPYPASEKPYPELYWSCRGSSVVQSSSAYWFRAWSLPGL